MLATNLNYKSQERYEFEEVLIDGKIELIKIKKEYYTENEEHKQLIIEISEGIEDSFQAQELKEQLEEKLNATIKVIKHTVDDQNAEEHFHFHILSNDKINNQTIYKVANDFIKAEEGVNMTQVRIYDNSKKNSFSLPSEVKAELQKVKEENFSFIKKDSKSHEIEEIKGYTKEGSKNATGLGKLDRPNYILNGVSNEKAKLISRFGIGMFKSDDLEITEETAKQGIKAFYESIGQELAQDWDKFINIEIEHSESEASINFNNLIVLKDGAIASTAKNLVEEHLTTILKGAISNESLIIENDDRLKPKNKVLAELQYLSGQEHKSEAEKEATAEAVEVETIQEQAKQSQATTDFYLDFMVEIKQIKTFEELEAKKAELESEAEKVKAVRGILPLELINEKLEQIEDKKELLSIVKVERTVEQALKEELEALKESLAAQTQLSEELKTELIKTTGELEETKQSLGEANELNKSLEEQAVNYRREIKDTKQSLEEANNNLADTKEELEAIKQSLASEQATSKKLSEELGDTTARLEAVEKVSQEQAEVIEELKAEQVKQKEAYEALEAKQTETAEQLEAEKVEVKKYSKLYNDVVAELETVKKKLEAKEDENKGLIQQIKDFTSEVFDLKDSVKNLTQQKATLETIKEELDEKVELGEAYAKQQDQRVEELEKFVNDGIAYTEQQEQEINELKTRIEELEDGKQGQGKGKGKSPK